jgi:SAM-dependent methyltransferase
MLIIQPDVKHRTEDFDLDPAVLSGLWRMEERHFWHAARNRWIANALEHHGLPPPAKVLEVGCGSGAVAGALHERGYSVVGVDTAEILVRKADQRFPAVTFVAGSIDQLAPELGPFDAIGLFDVLEHLDDPLSLLKAAIRHARPGALVVATVPAIGSLYSIVDELAGHKRRYEMGELKRTFADAGLNGVEEHGLFRLLIPLLRKRRHPGKAPSDVESRRRIMLADARIPPFPVNGLLRLACAAEARLGFSRSRDKAGPTILAIARTPGTPTMNPHGAQDGPGRRISKKSFSHTL